MQATNDQHWMLETAKGNLPLQEYRLRQAGREWTVLYTGAVLSREDETHFLRELRDHVPYGVTLWPAAIALAHEVASRASTLRGARLLELGAGTGLPGIVAASFSSQVIQSDREELALSLCRRNAARNGIKTITHRVDDWITWSDTQRYDYVLGADILYNAAMQPHLRRIFETSLLPGGKILLADPFRAVSFQLLEPMEADGWTIVLSTWQVEGDGSPRPIGIFELAPPP